MNAWVRRPGGLGAAEASSDVRIETRSIPSKGPQDPQLEILHAFPEGPRRGAPLLFLHGAFTGAWSWREVFLPFFARRGREALALSFRGHGGSGGRDGLNTATLSQYEDDIRRALALCPEPPVVIAHSLGGLVAQRLIGRTPMRALVLLASLPPDGLALVSPRLVLTEPVIWVEALLGSMTRQKGPVSDATSRLLFSEGLPAERVARYSAMMTPESPRALSEAHLPSFICPALMLGLRTLVIGGGLDRLVWRASTLRTAFYHGAEHQCVDSVGHFMQLDLGAEEVARRILDWVDRIEV
jgi:pimeloyl-ACP methyl ester carboxylesterase